LKDREYGRFCCDAVIEIFSNYGHPVLPEFLGPCLILLVDSSVPVPSKMAIAKFLRERSHDFLISELQNCQSLVTCVAQRTTDNVWKEFIEFIFQFDLPKMFVESMSQHCDKARFVALLTRYAISNRSSNISFRLSLCARLLMAGHWASTAKILRDLVASNDSDFFGSDSLLRDLLKAINTASAPQELILDVWRICIHLSELSDWNWKVLNDFISQSSSAAGGRWNVVPEETSSGCPCGLINLGSTDDVNCILQQVLRIPEFQDYLMTQKPAPGTWLKDLQILMTHLLRSKRKACNPESFFRMWSSLQEKSIDSARQRDAHEFLKEFFTALPIFVRNLFRGEFVVICRGIQMGAQIERRDITFSTFDLSVEKATLEGSLQHFSRLKLLHDWNPAHVNQGDRSDAYRTRHLTKTPPILVFHLKRFQRDNKTGLWTRRGTKFEFPYEFEWTLLNQQRERYVLHGVVLHTGEVQSGHYTSIIKCHEKWFEFNDCDVSEVSQGDFEQKSFGELDSAAYLLFYVKLDDTRSLGDLNIVLPCDVVQTIEADNARLALDCCAFSESLADIVFKRAAPEELVSYYFGILCHSKTTTMLDQFISRIGECDPVRLIDWMKQEDNFSPKIFPIFAECPTPEIVSSASTMIMNAVRSVRPEASISFFNLLVRSLDGLITSWERIPMVGRLLHDYLMVGDDHLSLAWEKGWISLIVRFIIRVYEIQRDDSVLSTLDLCSIFDCLLLLSTLDDTEALRSILDLFPILSKSECQVQNVRRFLVRCAEQGVFNVVDIAVLLPDELDPRRVVAIEIDRMTCDTFQSRFNSLLRLPDVTHHTIIAEMIEKSHKLCGVFISNIVVLLGWLTEMSEISQLTSQLILRLCLRLPDAQIVFDAMRNWLEHDAKVNDCFLRLLSEVVQIVDCPRQPVLPGLDKQPPSEALDCLMCYFISPGDEHVISLTNWCRSILPDLRDITHHFRTGENLTKLLEELQSGVNPHVSHNNEEPLPALLKVIENRVAALQYALDLGISGLWGLGSFDNPELLVKLLTCIAETVGGVTDFSVVPDTSKLATEDFESVSSDLRAGTFADVCKLRHRRTGKLYVQKVIQNHTSTVRSFQRALRLLSLANHPTLLSMSFIEGEKATILTDFMEGGSVYEIVQ
jgi:hypothetical protein